MRSLLLRAAWLNGEENYIHRMYQNMRRWFSDITSGDNRIRGMVFDKTSRRQSFKERSRLFRVNGVIWQEAFWFVSVLPEVYLYFESGLHLLQPFLSTYRKGTGVVDLSEKKDLSLYSTVMRSDGTSLYITRQVSSSVFIRFYFASKLLCMSTFITDSTDFEAFYFCSGTY